MEAPCPHCEKAIVIRFPVLTTGPDSTVEGATQYEKSTPQQTAGWECPSCKTAMQSAARFCSNCGTPQAAPKLNTLQLKRSCPKCNAPLSDKERFCGSCGASCSTEQKANPSAEGQATDNPMPTDSNHSDNYSWVLGKNWRFWLLVVCVYFGWKLIGGTFFGGDYEDAARNFIHYWMNRGPEAAAAHMDSRATEEARGVVKEMNLHRFDDKVFFVGNATWTMLDTGKQYPVKVFRVVPVWNAGGTYMPVELEISVAKDTEKILVVEPKL